VRELERAAALNPTHSAVHTNLGVAQLRLGNFAAAEAHAREALKRSSVNDRARYVLGMALGVSPERREEAIQELELAARTLPAAKALLALLDPER
jgi:Flp pilus assembly protein TadD